MFSDELFNVFNEGGSNVPAKSDKQSDKKSSSQTSGVNSKRQVSDRDEQISDRYVNLIFYTLFIFF